MSGPTRGLFRRQSNSGSSLVEVIVLGLGILLSLSFSIAALGDAQRKAIAVSASSRDAARSASVAADPSRAKEISSAVAKQTLATYGLDPSKGVVVVDGHFARANYVEVEVSYPVTLRLAGLFEASIPVRIASKTRFEIGPHHPLSR